MIRILLAHPSRLVCDSVRTALDNVNNVYVVGCATTKDELNFLLPHANIVLLGDELEKTSAFEVLEDLRLTNPDTKVLILGLDNHSEAIIKYIESGAAGYILQNESIEDMVQKLQAADNEKAIVSPSIAAALMNRLSQLANMETPLAFMKARKSQLDELTNREDEVLRLIVDGFTNQEIAEALTIECGTVKNHVHNILKKLDVNNRHEAASLFQMQQQQVMVA